MFVSLPANSPAILTDSASLFAVLLVDGMACRSVRFPWIGFPALLPVRWCVPSPADAFLFVRVSLAIFSDPPPRGEAKDEARPPSPIGTTLAQSCADLFWGEG